MVNREQFCKAIRSRRRHGGPAPQPRVVPAFTIQALQDNTVVKPPPRYSPYVERPPSGMSTFRRLYERGSLPIALEPDGIHVAWKDGLGLIDYHVYLPVLFDGLVERRTPYPKLVDRALTEMLEQGGSRILPCVPQLIRPIKRALDTKITEIVCRTLRAVQLLVRSGHCVGEALVPYFRQLLPVLNLLKDRTVNLGEGIDYAQQRGENIPDLIQQTLELLEQYGGEDAFINIKYIVPTYESCVKNI